MYMNVYHIYADSTHNRKPIKNPSISSFSKKKKIQLKVYVLLHFYLSGTWLFNASSKFDVWISCFGIKNIDTNNCTHLTPIIFN